jgi:hypothetical protein
VIAGQGMKNDRPYMDAQKNGDEPLPGFMQFLDQVDGAPGLLPRR